MKTIVLKKDAPVQMEKTICIQGNFYTLSSKRKFNAFVAHVNLVASHWLLELNEIYIQVFTDYRRAWFQMRNNRPHYSMKAETICITHLHAVEERFNHIVAHQSSAYLIFVDLKKVILFLNIVCGELEKLHRSKNNTMARHFVSILGKRLDAISTEIKNFNPTV